MTLFFRAPAAACRLQASALLLNNESERRSRTHQLFELSLSVAELLVHAEPHLGALQGGYDLQLGVFIFNDVVLQHQTQDLETYHAQVKAADILKHQNIW